MRLMLVSPLFYKCKHWLWNSCYFFSICVTLWTVNFSLALWRSYLEISIEPHDSLSLLNMHLTYLFNHKVWSDSLPEGLHMVLQQFQILQSLKQMLQSLSKNSAGLQTKLVTADELIKSVGLYMDHDKSCNNRIQCSKTLDTALTLHYFIFQKLFVFILFIIFMVGMVTA